MSRTFAKCRLMLLLGCLALSSALCSESSFSVENLAIVGDHGINAWCDNKTMNITREMWSISVSVDELAAIMAHEKAHLILKHGEKAWYEKAGGWVAGWFTDETKPRFRGPPDPKSVERENAADEKGLMLMAEAGYDPQAAVDFWTRYYERTGWWEGDGTHPKPRERLAHLNALMPRAMDLYCEAKNNKQKESAE